MNILVLTGFVFVDVPWEDSFKLGASAAAGEFYEWVQVGNEVYILYLKYQIEPHLSL